MSHSHTYLGALPGALACLALFGLPSLGCGEGEQKTTQQRGMPNQAPIGAGGSRRSGDAEGGSGEAEGGEGEGDRPERPRAVLTREDFSGRARDPFHNYISASAVDVPEAPVEIVRKQRDVKLSEYSFEELRLIAIVNAGRNVSPTALFLAGDNKSKSVRQGEYFSSAEVLLASVNRDYIEIEIIDPDLSPGWNMERGERKVIYLKDR